MAKMKIVFLLVFIFVLGYAEELEIYESHTDTMQNQLNMSKDKESENKPHIDEKQGLSIGADVYEAEGYSEMELYKGGVQNEFEAPMSRYGIGFRLNYSIQPVKIFKLSFFVSNGLEINMERRGGRIKAYDTIQRYEENVYNYGQRSMTYGLMNSVGMIIAIAEQHHISLTLKQTYNYQNMLGFSMNATESFALNNIETSQNSVTQNPYWLTTQIFLTYSYVF